MAEFLLTRPKGSSGLIRERRTVTAADTSLRLRAIFRYGRDASPVRYQALGSPCHTITIVRSFRPRITSQSSTKRFMTFALFHSTGVRMWVLTSGRGWVILGGTGKAIRWLSM